MRRVMQDPKRKRPAPESDVDWTDMKKNPLGWRPPKAEADATATRKGSAERGNIDLRDMNTVVNDPANTRGVSEADRVEREQRASQRPLTNEFSADTYGSSRRPGMEDAARAVGAPSNVGLRGARINNEGEPGMQPSPSLRSRRVRNRGVEEAINEGRADLDDVVAKRSARVKARRRR